MKIPKVNYGPVQSLGRGNVSAVGAQGRQAAASGAQAQKVMSLMAGVAGDYIYRQQNVEYDNVVAQTQIEINDFQKNHLAKTAYTADEMGNVPETVVPRTVTNSGPDGAPVVTPRTDIPSYEAYPQLLKQKLDGMTKVNAEKISNPVMRKEYLRKAGINNSQMMMTAGINAEKQQQEFVFKEGVANAQKAFKSGNFTEGAFYVNNLDIPEFEKEKMITQGGQDVEIYEVTQVTRSTDQELLLTTRSRYNDPNYDGDLTGPMARAAVNDINARLTVLGQEGIDDKATEADITYSNQIVSAQLGNLSINQIEAGYKLWQTDPDAKGAIDPKQRLTLRKAANTFADKEEATKKKNQTAKEKYVYAKMYTELNKGIDAGEINHVMLESRYQMGLEDPDSPTSLSPADYTTASRRIDTINNRNASTSTSASLGADLMSGNVTPDPYDSDQQNGVDDFVKLEGSAGDMRRQEEIAMITGIMSAPLENYLNGNALNGDPAKAAEALEVFGRLADTDAYKVREMGSEAKDVFLDAHFMARAGVEPVQAIEIARENARLPPEQKEQRAADYRAEKYVDTNSSTLENFMAKDEGVHGFDPNWVPFNAMKPDQAMNGEFNALVRAYYTRTGDIARSRQMAWVGIKEAWSSTGVGAVQDAEGNAVTGNRRNQKYSPERVMNVTTERANNALAAFSEGHGFDKDSVMVITDPQTARDGSWAIMVIDPETNMPIVPINDVDNTIIRWKGSEWINYGDAYGHAMKEQEVIRKREEEAALQKEFDESGYGEIQLPNG